MHYDDICFNTLLNFWYTFKGSGNNINTYMSVYTFIRIYIDTCTLYLYNNDLQNKNGFLFYWCVIL